MHCVVHALALSCSDNVVTTDNGQTESQCWSKELAVFLVDWWYVSPALFRLEESLSSPHQTYQIPSFLLVTGLPAAHSLCYCQWLVYGKPQPRSRHCRISVTGRERCQATLPGLCCGCFLEMPFALDSQLPNKAEEPLGISEFLFFMKWKGGYYLDLCSYFMWSMWYESSSGYFLAMELHRKVRSIWCHTSL